MKKAYNAYKFPEYKTSGSSTGRIKLNEKSIKESPKFSSFKNTDSVKKDKY